MAVRVLFTLTVLGVCLPAADATAQSMGDFSTPPVPVTDTPDSGASAEQAAAFVIPARSLNIPAAMPVSLTPSSAREARLVAPPWWATVMAAAGPLADGISTAWAMNQSGPAMRIGEGNKVFHKLFGSDVKGSEILAFKVGQAALTAALVHYGGKVDRERAIGTAAVNTMIHAAVAFLNVKNGLKAKRINAAYSVSW